MTETGVIHGRFQVLHNDHMKYLMAGKSRCKHLVVGITNPDPSLTRADAADEERSSAVANPLTYFERYISMRDALIEEGLKYEEFSVVPLPVNVPELYAYYVPLDAVFYLTIYDRWGKRKLELFQSMGLRTQVMWERPPEQKGITSTQVRELMISGDPWDHLVPPSVAELMTQWDVPSRLRSLGR
ncbi:nicotinate-nucleotide adenylyltransferase [Thermodesulfobacteriota bacterium]